MIVGGPALYLLGESLFRWRMTGVTKAKRVAVAALLVLLVALGDQVGALLLNIVVAAPLTVLGVWELRAPGLVGTAAARHVGTQGGRPLLTLHSDQPERHAPGRGGTSRSTPAAT
jgi:hypothetical protein